MDNDTVITNISKLGSMSTAVGCEAMRQLETESSRGKDFYIAGAIRSPKCIIIIVNVNVYPHLRLITNCQMLAGRCDPLSITDRITF